jgi:hypothetical protein
MLTIQNIEVISATAPMTGYGHKEVTAGIRHQRKTEENADALFQMHLKEARKKVTPIYNARGQLYDAHERNLDLVV